MIQNFAGREIVEAEVGKTMITQIVTQMHGPHISAHQRTTAAHQETTVAPPITIESQIMIVDREIMVVQEIEIIREISTVIRQIIVVQTFQTAVHRIIQTAVHLTAVFLINQIAVLQVMIETALTLVAAVRTRVLAEILVVQIFQAVVMGIGMTAVAEVLMGAAAVSVRKNGEILTKLAMMMEKMAQQCIPFKVGLNLELFNSMTIKR